MTKRSMNLTAIQKKDARSIIIATKKRNGRYRYVLMLRREGKKFDEISKMLGLCRAQGNALFRQACRAIKVQSFYNKKDVYAEYLEELQNMEIEDRLIFEADKETKQ